MEIDFGENEIDVDQLAYVFVLMDVRQGRKERMAAVRLCVTTVLR